MDREQGFNIRDYITILYRRWWIIILSFVVILSVTFYYMAKKPPAYESSSTIIMETGNPPFLLGKEIGGPTRPGRPLSFYMGAFNSRSFLREVTDSLALVLKAEGVPEETRQVALSSLRGNLTLNQLKYEGYLEIKAQAHDPKVAYLTAQIATDRFRDKVRSITQEEVLSSIDFLEEQLALKSKQLEKAEKNLQQFKMEMGIGMFSEGEGKGLAVPGEYARLEQAYLKAKTEKELSQAYLESISRKLAERNITASILNDSRKGSVVSEYRRRLSLLEERRRELGRNLPEDDPRITELDEQIDAVRSELIAFLVGGSDQSGSEVERLSALQNLQAKAISEELNLEVLTSREQYYQRLMEEYRREHPELLEQALELSRLTRAKEIIQQVFTMLLQRREEARIKAASESWGVKIIDSPLLPGDPIPKKTARWLLFSGLIGLFLGGGTAYLLEFLDTSLKSEADITRYLNLPLLGTIPSIKREASSSQRGDVENKGNIETGRKEKINPFGEKLLSRRSLKSLEAEAYRSLRTNLDFANVDKKIKTILISSPGLGEGKSLTTANLAISYAETGGKVLIVDGNLRKPAQHRIFGLDKVPGLTDLLSDSEKGVEDIIHKTPYNDLHVLTSGTAVPNPALIAGSDKLAALISRLRESYDLILLDSPPLVSLTDSVLLGRKVEGLLMMVKCAQTGREAAGHALDLLDKAGIKPLGVVLNDVKLSRGYGYYRYYRYYSYYDGERKKRKLRIWNRKRRKKA